MQRNVKTIALCGTLVALAIILSYVELKIPVMIAIPGMKIGLANIAVIVAFYLLGIKMAVFINVMRVAIVYLLFGNTVGLIYSLAGAFLSMLIMIILKISGRFSIVVISIAGAVCHNVGQIIAAVFISEVSAMYWYFIILWFTGIISGALIGMASYIIVSRLKNVMQ